MVSPIILFSDGHKKATEKSRNLLFLWRTQDGSTHFVLHHAVGSQAQGSERLVEFGHLAFYQIRTQQAEGALHAAHFGIFRQLRPAAQRAVEIEPIFGDHLDIGRQIVHGGGIGADNALFIELREQFHQQRRHFGMGKIIVFAQKLGAAGQQSVDIAE